MCSLTHIYPLVPAQAWGWCIAEKNPNIGSSSIHQEESNRAPQRGNQTSHLPKPS